MTANVVDVQAIIDEKPNARGLAVIVTNNYIERPKSYQHLRGCHVDGDEMKETLVDVHGFACCRVKNLTAQEMKDLLATTAQCRFSDSYKYISVVFSGHGEKGALIANDGEKVDVNQFVIDPFEPSRSPNNKHIIKLFFMDACRGGLQMERAQPKGAELGNYLVAYATTEGYVAWDFGGRGSQWMVPLAKMLREEDESVQNIVSMVTQDLQGKDRNAQGPRTIIACGVVKLFENGQAPVPVFHGQPSSPALQAEGQKGDSSPAWTPLTVDNVIFQLGEPKVTFPDYQWVKLANGLMLGGHTATIRNNDQSPTARMQALISYWLQNDENASWQLLVNAVKRSGFGNAARELAKNVGANPPK